MGPPLIDTILVNLNYISQYIIQQFGHCIASCNAMSQSLVKLKEIGTSWGRD